MELQKSKQEKIIIFITGENRRIRVRFSEVRIRIHTKMSRIRNTGKKTANIIGQYLHEGLRIHNYSSLLTEL